jgi:hypothetical protein
MKPEPKRTDPRWVEVVTFAGLAAVMSTGAGVALWKGIKVDDVLGLLGAVLGAGIGAWLAATAGRSAMISQRIADEADRRTFVGTVLRGVVEDLQVGSTFDTSDEKLTISTHIGETQVALLEQRAHRALDLVKDANEKVGADHRALRAFHTAIRTLREVSENAAEMLRGERTEAFGRGAVVFVQTARNSVRIKIEDALSDFECPSLNSKIGHKPLKGQPDDRADGAAIDAPRVSPVPDQNS